jgi:hypothetical protein
MFFMRKNTEQRILLGVSKMRWENATKISLKISWRKPKPGPLLRENRVPVLS